LKGMLKPVYEEKELGRAEIRAIFRSSKVGNIAGCLVTSGIMRHLLAGGMESLSTMPQFLKRKAFTTGKEAGDWERFAPAATRWTPRRPAVRHVHHRRAQLCGRVRTDPRGPGRLVAAQPPAGRQGR
ncbi:hypothetical protein, partial [Mycolicibacterium insubricum]|uniref:hypothetical protein n=1 Tax=Mycolicibacterium insubricum TaxID=444597 RepID=UPI0021F36EA5